MRALLSTEPPRGDAAESAAEMPDFEILDAYIARMTAAYERVTRRALTSSRFGRTRRAARKQAIRGLRQRGYSAEAAARIVDNAHDTFMRACLEAAARRTRSTLRHAQDVPIMSRPATPAAGDEYSSHQLV